MKIIYESIRDTVRKAVTEAEKANRRIERIELTWYENEQLKAECMEVYQVPSPVGFKGQVGMLYGVRLVVV